MQKATGDKCDAYLSIAAASEGLFKDRGSRFIAYAYPFTAVEELSGLMDKIRREHHAARHHCFAYRVGCGGFVFRTNDDGEPSGSAGRPILAAIDSAGLSDVLVVVVRYFGGILLGVPGLVRAYREAASDALAKAEKLQKYAAQRLELTFCYEQMNEVQSLLKSQEGVDVAAREFDNECRIEVSVRLGVKEDFLTKLNKLNNEKSTRIQCRTLQVAPGSN